MLSDKLEILRSIWGKETGGLGVWSYRTETGGQGCFGGDREWGLVVKFARTVTEISEYIWGGRDRGLIVQF